MEASLIESEARDGVIHPLTLRVMHWVNALAVIVMIVSGWRIYDAAPFFNFEIPRAFTLGGWLGGALAWHFAGMWLLLVNALLYASYGLASGHFRRRFLPLSVTQAAQDIAHAFGGALDHRPGQYSAAQRLAYVFVFIALIIVTLSGAAIWKPVQWQAVTALFGGYEIARRAHFFAMTVISIFVVLHVSLALYVKGALTPMITGRREQDR